MNLAIRELARQGRDGSGVWDFYCECGCMTLVHMTPLEFDAADGVFLEGHGDEARRNGRRLRPRG